MAIIQTLIGNVKGAKGDTGAQGAQGAQGEAATITVGTTTTAAYGTNASVTNSGTETDAILDFVIPQGAPGEEVTDASNLTLNEITASTADYPTFAVQEQLKGIFGKIQKFLSDLKNNYVSKSMMTTSTNVSTAGTYVADAQSIKSLNDALANIAPIEWSCPANSSYTTTDSIFGRHGRFIMACGHATNSGLRGLYVGLSNSVISPIIDATGLTVTISSGKVTIVNGTSQGANGVFY